MIQNKTLEEKVEEASHPWRDAELVEKLYWGEELTQKEIAEYFGCDQRTVERWFQKHDVESRGPSEARKGRGRVEYAHFRTRKDGYEEWSAYNGDGNDVVRVHRLLAVAEFGIDAVEGNAVHHENHIPWDNRASNIDVMGWKEHYVHHEYAESKWGANQ